MEQLSGNGWTIFHPALSDGGWDPRPFWTAARSGSREYRNYVIEGIGAATIW